jgi:hypothetical protein
MKNQRFRVQGSGLKQDIDTKIKLTHSGEVLQEL